MPESSFLNCFKRSMIRSLLRLMDAGGAAENPVAEIVVLVEAGDVAALKTHPIKPYSSSPKAIARYRDLAVMAIEAGSDNQSIWIFPATG
jgi:hypothetical protein